jgi:hypothetical protein
MAHCYEDCNVLYYTARSVCYGKEGASSSVSDVDDYVIIRKLFVSTFNVLSVFICRCKFRTYHHVSGFDYRRLLDW